MRAAVCREFKAPLEIEEVAIRPPGEGEVQVRVRACAICHSDISYADGDWGGRLPAVYGHEAAGIVEEVGPGTDGAVPGDRVAVTLVRSCGSCVSCRRGQPTQCSGHFGRDPVLRDSSGAPLFQALHTGAFAELVTVDASQVVRLPPDISFDAACLLSCGVLTGVGAVMNTAAVEPGRSVVVLGAGGVGLNCIQGAVLSGAEPVVAVDIVPAKLAAAADFGAGETVDASLVDPVEAVRELTGGAGADYVFVAAGVGSLVETGAAMLASSGAVVVVGMPPSGTTVSLDPVDIADRGLRVLGSKMGSSRPAEDIPRLAELYLAGRLKLDELISGRFPLEEVNDAIASARRGEQLRPVLVFP